MSSAPASGSSDREIVLSRLFHAPRSLVWAALCQPEHVGQWWGPNGFRTEIEQMDFRVGGVWKHVMIGPDGTRYPNKSVFKEILHEQRVVYSHGGGKENGKGASFVASWDFDEVSPKLTRLTLRMVFPDKEARDFVITEYGALEGGRQTLGRLCEFLLRGRTSSEELVISRFFKAPRDRVWKAWTETEHLFRWFGPKGVSVASAKMELHSGGSFHYCMTGTFGEMWGLWRLLEAKEGESLTLLQSFSNAAGEVTRSPFAATWPLETLSRTTFTDEGDGTRMILRWSPFNATEEEIATFKGGNGSSQAGWESTFQRLDGFLAE